MSVSPVLGEYTPSHQQSSPFPAGRGPPAPPPKAAGYATGSGQRTPQRYGDGGPPLPPPPMAGGLEGHGEQVRAHEVQQEGIPPPVDGWLPEMLLDKSTQDLITVINTPSLQTALTQSPTTAHPSLTHSTAVLHSALASNIGLANSLLHLEHQLTSARQTTQSRLLALRALERQWRTQQSEQDSALRDFSAPALYQRLSAASLEQELLCKGLEESFLMDGENGSDEGKKASEREVSEFVKRLKEARKVAYMRREQKERWDEGRIGGWRG